MTEREIFLEALEMATPEARAAYLQGACGPDVMLRRKVEELLKEHFSNDYLLAGSALEADRPEIVESPVEEAPAQRIGRYKLLEKIGEGGFGEVWMAEQREPVKRRVALKIIKPGMDSRQVVARFEAERQALAMMDHANIAKIFDAGTTDTGRPYFVMELVRGIKITEYCDQKQLPTAERLKLFTLVCQAIQHAHQKGIIHRDIKPSNILVTLHDGVPVPKVIDFGIAKATQGELTDKTVFTQFQQFIGTPAYISPEQAEMSGLDIDTRADIYSLGVLLYELLVGQTPFSANEMIHGGLDALRRIIREKEPLRPSTKLNTLQGEARTTAGKRRQTDVGRLVHQLRGDLDWIVMKCLEKDRARRYETANGLAMDIGRYLKNEPVIARPPSKAYQFQKLLRRNKVISTASALVLAVILVGTGISITQTLRAQRELRRALAAETQTQREMANARAAEREARQQLYTALLGEARATVRSAELGQRVRALEALRLAASISNRVELRREVFAALALPDLRFEREVAIGPNVTRAQCDPNFERVAICRGTAPVEICSLADGALIASLPASVGLPSYVALWSPNGRYLAVKRDHPPGGWRADWEVWEVPLAQRKLLLEDLRGEAISFHPRLNQVLAARGGAVTRWNLENAKEVSRIPVAREPRCLELSPDGECFAVVHEEAADQIVSLCNATTGAVLVSWRFSDFVGDLRWHPGGKWLAVADYSGTVQLLDCLTKEATILGRHKVEATTLAFSPAGNYLISGGWEKELICWDLGTLAPAFTIGLQSYHLQFSADGRRCATIARSKALHPFFHEFKLHTFEQPDALREFHEDLGSRLDQAAFSPDGRWLAASGSKHVGVWDLATNGPGALSDLDATARLFFTPDASKLFGSSRAGKWMQWRVTPGIRYGSANSAPELQPVALANPAGFNSVCLASNVMVWTCSSGSRIGAPDQPERERVWTPTASGMSGASPDARWLGVYHLDGNILSIYRLMTLEPVATLTNRGSIYNVQFSPKGDEVAVTSKERIDFWSTSTWQRTREIKGFMNILYAPDARTLWLMEDYRSAGLYDAATLELLLPLPTGMLPLALDPDGRQLVVSVDLSRLQVWDIPELRRQLRSLGLDWAD